MIHEWIQRLADGQHADIPRATYDLDEPIVMPDGADPIVTGNRAILRTHEEGMDAMVCNGPARIRDLRFLTEAKRGGAALRCTPEYQCSGLELSHVEVLAGGMDSAFQFGIVLDNCWNATLDVSIQGLPTDYTDKALLEPRMEIALDLGNCQAPRVKYQIGGAGIGIKSVSRKQGDAESIVLEGRWTQSCRRCIHLEGGVYGGFPTPDATIAATHFFYTQEGIFALNRHGLVIAPGVNLCGSHLDTNGTTAMWLVNCPDVKVIGTTIWRTLEGPRPWPAALGIVLDQTDGAVVNSNTLTSLMDLGIYQTSSCRNIVLGPNLNRATRPS